MFAFCVGELGFSEDVRPVGGHYRLRSSLTITIASSPSST
jgi:hypothetical protein